LPSFSSLLLNVKHIRYKQRNPPDSDIPVCEIQAGDGQFVVEMNNGQHLKCGKIDKRVGNMKTIVVQHLRLLAPSSWTSNPQTQNHIKTIVVQHLRLLAPSSWTPNPQTQNISTLDPQSLDPQSLRPQPLNPPNSPNLVSRPSIPPPSTPHPRPSTPSSDQAHESMPGHIYKSSTQTLC
jgi:hypothetical protein